MSNYMILNWASIPSEEAVADRKKELLAKLAERAENSSIDQVLLWEDPLIETLWISSILEAVAANDCMPISYIQGI